MKVGFIGLGQMGRGMAANLQKAGHDLVVSDLTQQAASQRGNTQWSSEYPRLGWAAEARGVTRREPAGWLARAEAGTGHLIQDHLFGVFSHVDGNRLRRGGGSVLRQCEGQRLSHDLPASF